MELRCEGGFINSQPSMGDFMAPYSSSSGGDVVPPLSVSPLTPSMFGLSATGADETAGIGPNLILSGQHSPITGSTNVSEYPWMKEKKTARKNHHQSKFFSDLFLNFLVRKLWNTCKNAAVNTIN
jgi:hypothetical protein